jgi:menaquinone-dependent protoporphyrinogen oxidase
MLPGQGECFGRRFMRILVAFASSKGSTAEIAERVAARLRGAGRDVDVADMEDGPNPSVYDAVVLGSAVHNQAWLPEASDFVSRHVSELSSLPLWLFSVGMPDGLPKLLRAKAKELQEKRILGLLGADVLQPRGHRMFSGVYNEGQLKGAAHFAFRLIGGRFGDFRDWAAIESWTDGISEELAARSGTLPGQG